MQVLKPERKWYAIYTKPRNEKKIYEKLVNEHIDAYLPLQTKIKQWSDRKKKVEEPLFSSYLFVNIIPKEYYSVLNTPGVVRYITFEGKMVAIPEKQIQTIKNLLEHHIEIEESFGHTCKGTKVEINAGPLAGLTGELIDFTNKKRVIIRLEHIQKSILINVPINYLVMVN